MEFRNFLLAALHPDDAALLVPSLKEVSLSRGQLLFDPGELVQSLYFPSSACVSVVSVMSDGRAVETSTVGHESAVGLLDAVSGLAINLAQNARYAEEASSGSRLEQLVQRGLEAEGRRDVLLWRLLLNQLCEEERFVGRGESEKYAFDTQMYLPFPFTVAGH